MTPSEEDLREVLEVLTPHGPQSVDTIAKRSELPRRRVTAALAELERQGKATKHTQWMNQNSYRWLWLLVYEPPTLETGADRP